MTNGSTGEVIGLDLSDQEGTYVVLSEAGQVVRDGKVKLTPAGLEKFFGGREPCLVALEVGTHSPWVSRALALLGYEVIVANPRQIRLIYRGGKKNDRLDAENLARLARVDPALLKPIKHRGEEAQADLSLVRARKGLVEVRTSLINRARGMVKGFGGRIPGCSAASFARKARPYVPEQLKKSVEHLLNMIAELTKEIGDCDKEIKELARTRYPETAILRQVGGVGPQGSLTYVLTLEEPQRFRRSREVGGYLGLVSRQGQSGEQKPQLHITKTGDVLLRTLMVQSAQYILGRHGPDTDLRRWGLKLAGSGNKTAKKKAIVAVARKLAVLLHRLWITGEVYEPLRQARLMEEAA
jgi:transposase